MRLRSHPIKPRLSKPLSASISMALSVTLSLAIATSPLTQVYAQVNNNITNTVNANSNPTSQNPNQGGYPQQVSNPLLTTENYAQAWFDASSLKSPARSQLAQSAENQKKYLEAALFYLQQKDNLKAYQYVLGAADSGNKGVLSAINTYNDYAKRMMLAAASDNRQIADAINTAPQLNPTAAPPTGPKLIPDIPVITPFPTTPATNDIGGNGVGLPSIVSADDQVQKLNDLLKQHPELRDFLWKVANERLGIAASDIGMNPNYYLTPSNPSVNHSLCNTYMPICSVLISGGVLDHDYVTPILHSKDLNYGIPLSIQAQTIIGDSTGLAIASGLAGPFISAVTGKTPIQGSWNQIIIDISSRIAMYYSTYGMVARLAALYNVQLDAFDKESLALLCLALSRVYFPVIDAGKATPRTLRAIAASPLMQKVLRAVARRKGKTDSPELAAALNNSTFLKAETELGPVIGTNGPNRIHSEDAAKKLNKMADPIDPSVIDAGGVDPLPNLPGEGLLPPGGIVGPGSGINPGGGIPGPGAPGDGKPPAPPPEEPGSGKVGRGARLLQLGTLAIQAAKDVSYQVAATQLSGQILNMIFSYSYNRDRQLQDNKFRRYLLSGANTSFLKLLILSQNPKALVIKDAGTPTTPPPGTPPTTPPTPPKTNPQPGPGPIGTTPPTPTSPPKFTATGDFRFIHKDEPPIGGDPVEFIKNLARTLHYCSAQDVANAERSAQELNVLVKKHPELNTWSSQAEPPEKGILDFLTHFFKTPALHETIRQLRDENKLSEDQVRGILLTHDCYQRKDTARYDELMLEMITFANFSDADVANLRNADTYIRLRMAEVIQQLIYLNGMPKDDTTAYFDKVLTILALNAPSYRPYFGFYQAELNDHKFEPYILSPTGYRLQDRPSDSPYDVTSMERYRPEEPQIMHPVEKPTPVNNSGYSIGGGWNSGIGGLGGNPGIVDPGFGPGGGGIGGGGIGTGGGIPFGGKTQ